MVCVFFISFQCWRRPLRSGCQDLGVLWNKMQAVFAAFDGVTPVRVGGFPRVIHKRNEPTVARVAAFWAIFGFIFTRSAADGAFWLRPHKCDHIGAVVWDLRSAGVIWRGVCDAIHWFRHWLVVTKRQRTRRLWQSLPASLFSMLISNFIVFSVFRVPPRQRCQS